MVQWPASEPRDADLCEFMLDDLDARYESNFIFRPLGVFVPDARLSSLALQDSRLSNILLVLIDLILADWCERELGRSLELSRAAPIENGSESACGESC